MGLDILFRGTFVHATKENPMEILEDRLLGIHHGKIVYIGNGKDQSQVAKEYGLSEAEVRVLGAREFLMPGFVDTHIHASQYPNSGTGLDLPLLEWLEKYTFPLESSFSNMDFAEEAYRKAVKRVVKNGTTTACYFATIHVEATIMLCRVVEEVGQRAYVGKVNMDQNSPDYYRETTQQSIEDTEKFIKSVLDFKNDLVTPVVTPRFAICSSKDLMDGLGKLAKKYEIPIQTHISESVAEVEFTRELFPGADSYADVYDACGLLTNKTILAHGVHLTDSELSLIKERGAGISHCPSSNLNLRSGMLEVWRLIKNGVKVGLGTDVSAGMPSMLESIQSALYTSNMLSINKENAHKLLDYKDVFRLATLGSSEVLGLQDKIGNFELGKEFDALLVNTAAPNSPMDIFERDTVTDMVQKFIYLGDDRNIQEVYVAGKKVLLSSQ